MHINGGESMAIKVTRREFLKLGATSAAAVLLARCAPAATQAPEEPGEAPEGQPVAEAVTINFLAWGILQT